MSEQCPMKCLKILEQRDFLRTDSGFMVLCRSRPDILHHSCEWMQMEIDQEG